MKTGAASPGAGGGLATKPEPARAPAAPALGRGRELLNAVVGFFSLYLIWVAVRRHARRLCRFIRRKLGLNVAPGAHKFRRYRGPHN